MSNKKNIDIDIVCDFYKEIFDESPCYLTVQNEQLQIVASNKRFKIDFGDFNGSYCYKVYKHRESPCVVCPVLLTFEDGKSHSTEEVVTTKSGKQHNVITWTSPIKNERNNILRVVEMSTDITKIRQVQNRLTSLGLMISSVSHGLRGMLTALDGGIYKLETGIKKSKKNRILPALKVVKKTTGRIRDTILEILYYSKSRNFKYQLINVSDLLINIIEDFKATSLKKKIEFEVFNMCSFENLEVDSSWLYIALSNFIENSIDACISDKLKKKHFIKINIEDMDSDNIEFSIQDNGIGMRREIKDKLFTLFFSSKGSQGTGLGLFIANQIISQHGGSISVESQPLKGTTIKIRLPRRQKLKKAKE